MAHSLQGVYSPLPQSLSDSDSDKEISMEPVCPNYGNSNIKRTKLENSYGQRQNGHFDFNSMNDILKIKRVNPRMSTMRKTAFVFSILLCFLPIVIFLWILPCSNSNTCPASISNWENQQDNVELLGNINLVHGAFQNSFNLAVMYKGSFFKNSKMPKNGIISYIGSSGAVAWDFQQESYPTEINCSIIDIDGNGYNDCLVTDGNGLKAIETISGVVIWHANSDQEKSIHQVDMPIRITDFDNDGLDDLLSIYKKESFLIISGKTGKALSNLKLPSICMSIGNLTLNNFALRYDCSMEQKPKKTFEITFGHLKTIFENPNKNFNPMEIITIPQVTYEIGNWKLMIENSGGCPRCQSTISLFSSNNTKMKSISYQNAYTMTPVSFSFQQTDNNILTLKGHIHGFILKIWQWKNNSTKKLPPTEIVYKRSLSPHNKTPYLNEISETVVLITFNETDTHIVNASLTDGYQICTEADDLSTCQPHHLNQEKSLLIADMDRDNSLELISFSSSYIEREDENGNNWHLVSSVKVLRLENELPKLYESKHISDTV